MTSTGCVGVARPSPVDPGGAATAAALQALAIALVSGACKVRDPVGGCLKLGVAPVGERRSGATAAWPGWTAPLSGVRQMAGYEGRWGDGPRFRTPIGTATLSQHGLGSWMRQLDDREKDLAVGCDCVLRAEM